MQPPDSKEQDKIPRTIRFMPDVWRSLSEVVYAAKLRGEKAGFDSEVNRAVEAWLAQASEKSVTTTSTIPSRHQRQIDLMMEVLESGERPLVEALNATLKALAGAVRGRKDSADSSTEHEHG